MGKVIVTGVAGFIGSHTAKKFLDNNIKVIGIDNYSCGFGNNINDLFGYNHFKFIKDDIRSIEDIGEDVDAVFHFAARGDIPFCLSQPREAIDINVFGTINILNLANKCKAKHFYFADTCAEYDGLVDEAYYPLQEMYAPNIFSPIGSYGITKMAAAQFVRSYGLKYGFGTTILRYTNIYGPSMNLTREVPPVIGGFANKILRLEPAIIYGDGSKTRDFIYVKDLADLHYNFFQNKLYEKGTITYNIGSGKSVSIKDVYKLVYKVCKTLKSNILEEESVIYKENRNDEAQDIIVDNSLIKRNTGWKPSVSIEKGIIETVQCIYEMQRTSLLLNKNKNKLITHKRLNNE